MTQRYRLTWEFDLRDPSDYLLVNRLVRAALSELSESIGPSRLAPDWSMIEKVPPKEHT